MRFFLSLFLCCFCYVHFVQGQCISNDFSTEHLFNKAILVVEGKVLSQSVQHHGNHLYTQSIFKPSLCLKGAVSSEICVLHEGGETDTLLELAFPSASLRLGASYRLYLEPVPHKPGSWRCLGAKAGAHVLNTVSQEDHLSLKDFSVPVITGVFPASLASGRNEKISILGSGFGNTNANGQVLFSDANAGGSEFSAAPLGDFLLWSDSKIELYVPDFAGTGPIRVVKNGVGVNSAPLKIEWARTNYIKDNTAYQPLLQDKNSTGGYFFSCIGKLANDSLAVARIREAIRTWRCATGINFSYAKEPEGQTENIQFADPGELATGVLGICYTTFSGCTDKDWYVSRINIRFRDSINWHMQEEVPSTQAFDFFSVALHELGHAMMLGHVIDATDVMHYSIGKGITRRNPTTANNEAGEYVMLQSASEVCAQQALRKLNITMCADEEVSFFAFNNAKLYPNPVNESLYVELFTDRNIKGTAELFDLMGKLMWSLPLDLLAGRNAYRADLANNLASGIYLLRIKAEGNLLERKLVLSR